ncbi:MAG: hypothetical protein KAJ49_03835 [Arcobacteraceae bacterium]|nr:hypothetical protein [Arcobacteraceae bacterium]
MIESDATLYHIPKILSLNYDNFLQYILDYTNYISTGKLTHVFYAIFLYLFEPIRELNGMDIDKFLMIIVYIINSCMLLLVVYYLSTILNNEKIESQFIIYAVSLILFSPFILYHSAFILKETLYFSLIILSIIAIFRSNYLLLFIICIFFFVDRMYMLYFFAILFILSNKITYKHYIISLLIVMTILLTYDNILGILKSFIHTYSVLLSKTEIQALDTSLVNSNNIFFNTARALFNPFFLSAFKDMFLEQNIFFKEFFTVYPMIIYFLVKILIDKINKFTILILILFLINIILFPYSMKQKLTILIPLLSIIYPLYLHCRKNNIELKTFWRI